MSRGCIEPQPVSEADLRGSEPTPTGRATGWKVGCVGFGVGVIAIIAYSVSGKADRVLSTLPVEGSLTLLFAVVLGIPIVLGLIAAKLQRTEEIRRWRNDELFARKKSAQDEATRATERVCEIEGEAASVAGDLPPLLDQVRYELRKAEDEIGERAYGPFWDRIARVAKLLASYRIRLERLGWLSKEYADLLSGRCHSFPETLRIQGPVPDPTDLATRLGGLARDGQKDFEFAMIWEHHKTRRVVVEGFSTLENTLRNLEGALEGSLAECAVEIAGTISQAERGVRTSVDRGAEKVSARLKRIEDGLDKT